jgi:hypothetical protein
LSLLLLRVLCAVLLHAGAELRKVHFAEEWNELHHLQVGELASFTSTQGALCACVFL